ncbi:MAG: helix-turn-helix domain-containing protein [Actinomycetota bacterium]|nr:helix-turn-helix domain-containing protein [Actinomycetota bacterium]
MTTPDAPLVNGDAPDTAPASRHHVRAVERAFRVIKAFDADHPRLTLSDVARATGLDRATARRLLLTLEDLGYVRAGRREFELTAKLLELGFAYLSGLSLVDVVQPHLSELARDLNETASLTVLDGDDVVYLGIATGRRLATVKITVGTRFSAYATSMGRILLAGLSADEFADYLGRLRLEAHTPHSVRTVEDLRTAIDLARERGWALVDQELDDGLRGLAVPVHDRSGAVVAALNVSVQMTGATTEQLTEKYVPRLRQAAAAAEADLSGRPQRR